jgi:copper chaperone NosL
MVDFYKWEYDYGHNLDPHAAIKVPGMSYQPPLIGYKQLLNFGAYSIPDIGGWLFIGAGVILFIAYLLILQPKWLPFAKSRTVPISILAICLLSCSSGPQPINYGRDACDYCKMTIVDKRFACQWVTDKGKAFRFDDVHCLLSDGKLHETKGSAYVNDFDGEKLLIPAEEMSFVKSEKLQTPMGGMVAAFTKNGDAADFAKNNNGRKLTWQQVTTELKK